jgi:hypothetical protein
LTSLEYWIARRSLSSGGHSADPLAGNDDYTVVIASGAKQSIVPHKERMDCFVASLLAMTANMTSHPRGAMRPSR